MNKFLFKITKPFIKRRIKKLLEDEKLKNDVVSKINDKMDIPNVDEAKEKELLELIYVTLGELITDVLEEV